MNETIKKEKNIRYTLIAIFIIAIGVFLRLYNINSQSLSLDEAQSVWQASHSVQFINNYMAQNVHLPLHNNLLHIWMLFFGSSETSVRMLSALPGILSLPALYLLAYEITSSKKKSLFVLLIASLSPFLIWYSRTIRMYMLLSLVTTLSYYFYLRILKKATPLNITFYIITNLIGMYTHYFFNLTLFIQFLFLLISLRMNWYPEIRKDKNKIIFIFLLSVILLITAFIPWLMFFLKTNMGGDLSPNLEKPTGFSVVLSIFQFTLGYQPDVVTTVVIAFWPLLCLLGFVFLKKRDGLITPNIYLTLLGAFLPPILVFIVSDIYKPMYLTRYLISSTPLYIIFLSWIILELKSKLRIAISVMFVLGLLGALYNQFNNSDIPEKENYREAVSYVDSIATPKDIVLVTPPYTLFPVQFYYSGSSKLTTLPIWNRTQLNLPKITSEQLSSDVSYLKEGHLRMYVITTLNLAGGYDVQNYLDHNLTRLDAKQFSKYIWVYTYQADYSHNFSDLIKSDSNSVFVNTEP